ncbi:type IX secretion system periplasmic lipoprotein PorW/SprE [Xylanibacter brevis]|uniref:type IX secretion system periplasmic lipoprotein PorW/SprE n=1 Tax=Xylanibacter brevis TaxID=83231 RepID=UPI00069336F9|nr:tetratricopeptide repeat protein [Xylanibacter brevis]
MRRLLYIGIGSVISFLLMTACSTQKNTGNSRFWHSFTAKYNTYYNGSLAYIEGDEEKEKGNKDNFTEMLPLYVVGNKKSRDLGKGKYDRTIEKMEKTIKLHSIKAKPVWNKTRKKTARDREWLSRGEYNPFLWKAWMLMGQAQFQKGAFDEAAATFSYVSRLYQGQPAINGMARAWLARCYTELDWLYDAEDVIRNMNRDSIHYKAQKTWDATMADFYLKNGELEKALPYLHKTAKHEKRTAQKARIWYLTGQVEAALNHKELSYKAYQKVVRLNPPYELEFNARIAQTEVMAKGNAKKMISRLKRMAASDNNKDYLDQVYYAIGNIYLMQNDTAKAIGAYEKGNEKATRSGIEKGVLLLKLGDLYWIKEKYNDAQRCYGEAIGLLDKDREDYEELAHRSKVLDELVPHTDAVYLQDSLQVLAKLPEKERLAAIDRVIDALKKKEKEERDKALEAQVNKLQQSISATNGRNTRNTTPQQNNTTSRDGKWYFYNQMAVNQGKQQFQRQWGKRENVDDWQRANKTVVNLQGEANGEETTDSLNTAENEENNEVSNESDTAENDTLANDPHNREYYLAQIPFTEDQLAESNATIMDGLFNSGIIFKDKLENLKLSEKQLLRLTSQYPEYEQNDQAWYHLFLLYSLRGDTLMANNCLARMQADYPESEWTILLSDPYFEENARFGEHLEDSIYGATYEAFKANKHEMIQANAKLSAERFPLGENRAKFLFINGLSLLNQGDAKGCVENLKTVVEKYPQSEVSEMAGMIVKGVQEGRTLHGGKFDLDDIWSRRDITASNDSVAADTLSAERNVPFLFILVYQPDSLNEHSTEGRATSGENQLLFEMARFNFSNFMVRNFDMEIERDNGINRMMIRGFLNFDEALQYARQLHAAEAMGKMLKRCRTLVISEHNLALIGTRYSYKDYDEFYEKTFLPLPISNEDLLQQPDYEQPVIDAEDEPTSKQEEDSGDDDEFELEDLW